jgi:hypothetical protein
MPWISKVPSMALLSSTKISKFGRLAKSYGNGPGLKELKLKSNCVKEFEKALKLGRRQMKLLCDKSNTARFAEVLKIDVGIIEPLKWFELKFTY